MFCTKKNISILLLTLLVFILSCSLLQNILIIVHQHKEAKQAGYNIILRMSLAEWASISNNNHKEVLIDQQLFDVKSVQFDNDQVKVCGHFDNKEEQLRAKLKQWNKSTSYSISFMSFFYAEDLTSYTIPYREFTFVQFHLGNTDRLGLIYYDIELPPPNELA